MRMKLKHYTTKNQLNIKVNSNAGNEGCKKLQGILNTNSTRQRTLHINKRFNTVRIYNNNKHLHTDPQNI